MQPKQIDEIVQRVSAALPEGLERLGADVRNNLRAALSAALSRMDVVRREEFEVQSAVLARTRERLEQMEARIARLEKTDERVERAP